MRPSKLPIQAAIKSRLEGNVGLDVGTDPGVPGIEIGDDDETEIRETTNSVHTDLAHTIRVRAFSETKAKKEGEEVVAQLTDRDNRLSLAAPFHVLHAEVTGADMQRSRRTDGPDIFTELIIITYRVTRT